MKIRIDNILPDGLPLDCDIIPNDIDQSDFDFAIVEPIHFCGGLTPFNSGIMLEGRFNTSIQTRCGRCLTTFTTAISDTFKLFFTQSLRCDEDDDDTQETMDNVDCEQISDVIDLTLYLREQVILHVPLKIICDENCKGLCPHCGINLNENSCTCDTVSIDPRLFKLKQLFENK